MSKLLLSYQLLHWYWSWRSPLQVAAEEEVKVEEAPAVTMAAIPGVRPALREFGK